MHTQNSKRVKTKFQKLDKTKIFDILSSKCTNFTACHCLKDIKVPLAEKDFLMDQLSSRLMIIVSVGSKKLSNKRKRLQKKAVKRKVYEKEYYTVNPSMTKSDFYSYGNDTDGE